MGDITIKMSNEICPTCGIAFCVPQTVMDRHLKEGTSWRCPNGHLIVYTESTLTRTKKELAQAKEKVKRLSRREEVLLERLECYKRSNAALRAVITRMKNKAASTS